MLYRSIMRDKETIMKKPDTFLFKNISLYFLKGPKRMKERQRQRNGGGRHRLAENCYIDLFLTHVFRAPLSTSASSMRGFQQGSAVGHCPPHTHTHWVVPRAASVLTWLWLQLADHNWHDSVTACGYLCIYNTHSSCDSHDLFPLVNPCKLYSCLHSWNILSQKSLIDSSVKSQYVIWIWNEWFQQFFFEKYCHKSLSYIQKTKEKKCFFPKWGISVQQKW